MVSWSLVVLTPTDVNPTGLTKSLLWLELYLTTTGVVVAIPTDCPGLKSRVMLSPLASKCEVETETVVSTLLTVAVT